MLETYAAVVALLGLTVVVGQAVLCLTRAPSSSRLAPGLGMGVILVVANIAVRLPGHGRTALIALAVLFVAAAAVVLRSGPRLSRAAAPAAVAGLLAAIGASIPFLVAGRVGVLGVGMDNDLAIHFTLVESLGRTGHVGPVTYMSYPTGPHAVVAALARPFGIAPAFTALIVACPVLTALTAAGALHRIALAWRGPAAALAALTYLPAAYLGEGSYKEPLMALLVLTLALGLEDGEVGRRVRGVLVGVIACGSLMTFGALGLAWPVAMVAIRWAVRRWPKGLPASVGAGTVIRVLALGVVALLLLGGLIHNLAGLGDTARIRPSDGNIIGTQISARKVLGVWFAQDFRLGTDAPIVALVGTILALLALARGVVLRIRRGALGLPVGLLAASAVWAASELQLSAYLSAKGLVIAAPLVAVLIVEGALEGFPGPGALARRTRLSSGRAAQGTLAVGVVALVAWSSLLVLRASPVGPLDRTKELQTLATTIGPARTLALLDDDFVRWELAPAALSAPDPYGFFNDVGLLRRVPRDAPRFDFDSVLPVTLDRFRYVVTARTLHTSQAPPNFRRVRATRSYVLWERVSGPTPRRSVIEPPEEPGRVLDCHTRSDRALSRKVGRAAVRATTPVIGDWSAWVLTSGAIPHNGGGTAQARPGEGLRQLMALPAGRWELSLQYESPVAIELRVNGARLRLPPAQQDGGTYFSAGRVTSPGGQVLIGVNVARARRGALGRTAQIGRVAAERVPGRNVMVPLRRACGRYVDWYEQP